MKKNLTNTAMFAPTLTGMALLAVAASSALTPALAADPTAAPTGSTETNNSSAPAPTEADISNAGDLEKAVQDAKNAGVTVTKDADQSKTVDNADQDEAISAAEKSNADQIDALKKATADQKQKMADYNKAKAAYDKTVNDQIGESADPSKAIVIADRLAYSQPFTINSNNDSLDEKSIKLSGTTAAIDGIVTPTYNSKGKITYTVNNNSTITATWKNVAKDIETGRPLDATVTFNDFTVDDSISQKGRRVTVYSNFIDNVYTSGVFNVDETFNLKYADGNKEAYDKRFYVNAGSLNAQSESQDRNDPAARYEFAAPGNKTISTFIAKDSLVYPEAQEVQGQASRSTPTAYMVEQGKSQGGGIPDNEQAIKKLGVSFLIENGGNISFGVSGYNGQDPKAVSYADRLNNHILTATTSIAATITAPVKPVTEANYHVNRVLVNAPADAKLNKFGVEVTDNNDGTRKVTYGFQVKNAGGSRLDNPVLTEEFGEGLVKDSISWTGLPDGAKVSEDKTSVTLPTEAAGDSYTVYATVDVEKGYVAKDMVNAASVTSPTDPEAGQTCDQDATASVDDDTDGCDTVVIPIPASELKIHKVFDRKETPKAGADTAFTITATNAGAGNAGSVDITDVPGAGLDKKSVKITKVEVTDPGTPVKYAEKQGDATVDLSKDGSTEPVADGGTDGDTQPTSAPVDSVTDEGTASPSASASASPSASASASPSASASSDPTSGATDDASAVPQYTIDGTKVHFTNLNPGAQVKISVTAKFAEDLGYDADVKNTTTITSPDDPGKGKGNGKTNPDLDSDDDGFDGVMAKSAGMTPPPTTEPEETAPPVTKPEKPAEDQTLVQTGLASEQGGPGWLGWTLIGLGSVAGLGLLGWGVRRSTHNR